MNRLVIVGFCVLAASPAAAQTIERAFSDFDLQKCRHIPGEAEEDYGEWHCEGYGGMPVWMGAGDQRVMISFGPRAQDELARLRAHNEPGALPPVPVLEGHDGTLGVLDGETQGGRAR